MRIPPISEHSLTHFFYPRVVLLLLMATARVHTLNFFCTVSCFVFLVGTKSSVTMQLLESTCLKSTIRRAVQRNFHSL